MNRRFFISRTTVGSAGLVFLPHLLRGQTTQEPTGLLKPLTGDAGYYTERGGTIGYLRTPNGIIVVDSQFPEQAKHFISSIREKFAGKFILLINTHHHGDHTGGNIAFKPYINRVVAHVNSAKYQKIVAEKRQTEEKQYYPTETFEKSWADDFDGTKVTATWFGPAHTSGDSVIHFEKEQVVHMGDLVFNRRHPYIDRGAGASIENWISVLGKVQKEYGRTVTYIFGHARDPEGVTGTSEDLGQMANYLDALLTTARKAIAEGKQKSDLANIKQLRGFEDYAGNRVKINLETAWDELQGTEPS